MNELIAAAKRTMFFIGENQQDVAEPKACGRHDSTSRGYKARLKADPIIKNTAR
ncbi:hypothetical protein [Acidovorax cavernicola]|uniref:hypothetical protein n=1 Tax=Acidovorax cavernicola TaxID=1675792 RepID=UPI00142E07B6|nr:hypothetical protein [Acidovorax cavernicola]